MSQDINDAFVTPISERESMDYLIEGLKMASSYARQLAKAQNHEIWMDISKILKEMENRSLYLAQGKSLSRQATLRVLDQMEVDTNKKLEASRPPVKPKIIL